MSDGLIAATAVLAFIIALGGALTVLKVWVWEPVNHEADFREDLREILAALTPDHGESLADFIAQTKSTATRIEDALEAHCKDAASRMDATASAIAMTNLRIDHLVHSLAGVALRREDREGVFTRSTDVPELVFEEAGNAGSTADG